MQPIVIGIAGTAKNTGKTTTTNAIMAEIKKQSDIRLGLTSIGYDGEDIDNVTGLPKPKIKVWPGILVAVAEKCLEFSTAKIEVICNTKIRTPLGQIVIGRVNKEGSLTIAGPNKRRELKTILDLLKQYNADFIIVDGALNRIAPMVEVDGLILATGAAKTPNINKLAVEAQTIVDILQCPILEANGEVISVGCILDTTAVDELIEKLASNQGVDIQGIIGEQSLKYLVTHLKKLQGKQIIFSDAIKLLLCSDIHNMQNVLNEFTKAKVKIGAKKSVKIIALTINPYYPQYRFASDDYLEAYVDKDQLIKVVKEKVAVPVHDVIKDGGEKLFQDIVDYWQRLIDKRAM